MKYNIFINRLLLFGTFAATIVSCSEDVENNSGISEFAKITPEVRSEITVTDGYEGTYLLYYKLDAATQLSDVTVEVSAGTSSTASEDVDFEILEDEFEFLAFGGQDGFVVPVTVFSDADDEGDETIYLQFTTTLPSGINTEVLAINIKDTCPADNVGAWAGLMEALEDYGGFGTYGPYEILLEQDATDPNKFYLSNFYDSGFDTYIVFEDDGTVSFPDQNAEGDTTSPEITASTGTYDICDGEITINLNYDGLDWVYRLTKL